MGIGNLPRLLAKSVDNSRSALLMVYTSLVEVVVTGLVVLVAGVAGLVAVLVLAFA